MNPPLRQRLGVHPGDGDEGGYHDVQGDQHAGQEQSHPPVTQHNNLTTDTISKVINKLPDILINNEAIHAGQVYRADNAV